MPRDLKSGTTLRPWNTAVWPPSTSSADTRATYRSHRRKQETWLCMHIPRTFVFFCGDRPLPYHSALHPGDEDETSRLLQPAVEGSSHVVQAVVGVTTADVQDLQHELKNWVTTLFLDLLLFSFGASWSLLVREQLRINPQKLLLTDQCWKKSPVHLPTNFPNWNQTRDFTVKCYKTTQASGCKQELLLL